jgi:RNA polymerase primary sigma factor
MPTFRQEPIKSRKKESKKRNRFFDDLPEPLSLKKEQRLIRRYRDKNDIDARNLLIEANLPFAITVLDSVAKRRSPHYFGGLYETMIDSCLYAAETIEGRNIKFASYLSSFLSRNLLEYRPDTDSNGRELINASDHGKHRLGSFLDRALKKFYEKNDNEKDEQPISLLRRTDRHYSQNRLIPIRLNHISSQSQFWLNEEGWKYRNFEEGIIDGNSKNPEEIYIEKEKKEFLEKAWETLDERCEKVLRQYFLEDETLDQIGKSIGLTRGRIGQIKEKALLKLKNSSSMPYEVFEEYFPIEPCKDEEETKFLDSREYNEFYASALQEDYMRDRLSSAEKIARSGEWHDNLDLLLMRARQFGTKEDEDFLDTEERRIREIKERYASKRKYSHLREALNFARKKSTKTETIIIEHLREAEKLSDIPLSKSVYEKIWSIYGKNNPW